MLVNALSIINLIVTIATVQGNDLPPLIRREGESMSEPKIIVPYEAMYNETFEKLGHIQAEKWQLENDLRAKDQEIARLKDRESQLLKIEDDLLRKCRALEAAIKDAVVAIEVGFPDEVIKAKFLERLHGLLEK